MEPLLVADAPGEGAREAAEAVDEVMDGWLAFSCGLLVHRHGVASPYGAYAALLALCTLSPLSFFVFYIHSFTSVAAWIALSATSVPTLVAGHAVVRSRRFRLAMVEVTAGSFGHKALRDMVRSACASGWLTFSGFALPSAGVFFYIYTTDATRSASPAGTVLDIVVSVFFFLGFFGIVAHIVTCVTLFSSVMTAAVRRFGDEAAEQRPTGNGEWLRRMVERYNALLGVRAALPRAVGVFVALLLLLSGFALVLVTADVLRGKDTPSERSNVAPAVLLIAAALLVSVRLAAVNAAGKRALRQDALPLALGDVGDDADAERTVVLRHAALREHVGAHPIAIDLLGFNLSYAFIFRVLSVLVSTGALVAQRQLR